MFMFRFTQKKWKTKIKVMLLDDKKFTIYGHEERRKDKMRTMVRKDAHGECKKLRRLLFIDPTAQSSFFCPMSCISLSLREKLHRKKGFVAYIARFWIYILDVSSLSLSLFLFCFMNLHGYLRWIYSSESLLCIRRYK